MAQLGILGSQRVKALIAMLKEKENKEVNALMNEQMPILEATQIVNKEFGVNKYMDEIDKIRQRLNEINILTKDTIGKHYSLNEHFNYSNDSRSKYMTRIKELTIGDTDKKINEIHDAYKRKEQLLWLCETLEEAKEIVGI